jgi:pyridoxal phosphate enzyme (YggS family)
MTEKLCKLEERYALIQENVQKSLEKSGRTDSVRIMAVTKTVDVETVNSAIALGVDLLGENRVQEFLQKRDGYKPCEVHFIGGLQTNKVRKIIGQVKMFHSVDSYKLAGEINRQSCLCGKKTDILIQVNIGEEETKGGVSVSQINELVYKINEMKNLRFRGLMAIPPVRESERHFAQMREAFEFVKKTSGNETCDTLSMGMSGDYETAIQYGATIVRVGSALFGDRGAG